MEINLEKVIEEVRVVDEDRKYWFVRTFSGELYKDFLEKKYVGFGFNNIPMSYIKEASKSKSDYNKLRDYIENNTQYVSGEATKWTNQLIGFESQIQIGDIVMIPNKDSDELSFGIIESNTFLIEQPGTFLFKEKYEAYPEKRRKVRWIKTTKREELGAEMNGLISSRQGLTNAGWYSQFIEGNLSTVYIKNDKVYLNIKINQDEEINAFHLSRFLSSLTYFYKEFCLEFDEEFDEDLFVKIKLQSKGRMLFNGACKAAGIALLGLIAISSHSEFEADFLVFKLKAKTGDGPLKTLSDWKDAELERKMKFAEWEDSIAKLKIKPVETDTAVLEENNSGQVKEATKKN